MLSLILVIDRNDGTESIFHSQEFSLPHDHHFNWGIFVFVRHQWDGMVYLPFVVVLLTGKYRDW